MKHSRRLTRSWAGAIQQGLVGAVLLSLRAVGLVLPVPILATLLWPIALLRAAWELGWGGPACRQFRILSGPPLFPPGDGPAIGKLLLGRARLNLARLLFLWPERSTTERGFRCRLVGAERLEGLGTRGPAILVTLHFGPLAILLNWLRARGYPVAMVVMKDRPVPWYRRYLVRLRDTPTGLANLPSIIEVGQIGAMRDHLEAGRILIIAIDGGQGRHSACPSRESLSLSMSTGALQLAAMVGASVIPCLIRSGRSFSLTIHLGEPVDLSSITSRSGHPAACDHLLCEFLVVIAEAPEECSPELLVSFRRDHRATKPVS